jgi:hypothetical protein
MSTWISKNGQTTVEFLTCAECQDFVWEHPSWSDVEENNEYRYRVHPMDCSGNYIGEVKMFLTYSAANRYAMSGGIWAAEVERIA